MSVMKRTLLLSLLVLALCLLTACAPQPEETASPEPLLVGYKPCLHKCTYP